MDIPARMLEPAQIAPDTFVIRQLFGEGLNPVAMHVNSMVITGAEPVIVDCGPAVTRQAWLDTVFGIVDPSDVRWIFLSHDDIDHTGNLPQVLDLCPQATLVTNWFSMERMASEYLLPLAPDAVGERRRALPPPATASSSPSCPPRSTAPPPAGSSTPRRASTGPPTASPAP